jgi:hypothetical protein
MQSKVLTQEYALFKNTIDLLEDFSQKLICTVTVTEFRQSLSFS